MQQPAAQPSPDGQKHRGQRRAHRKYSGIAVCGRTPGRRTGAAPQAVVEHEGNGRTRGDPCTRTKREGSSCSGGEDAELGLVRTRKARRAYGGRSSIPTLRLKSWSSGRTQRIRCVASVPMRLLFEMPLDSSPATASRTAATHWSTSPSSRRGYDVSCYRTAA